MNDSRIIYGIEFYCTSGHVESRCARCGSTVTLTHEEELAYQCASSAEWCKANPMAGRERERGAGHG